MIGNPQVGYNSASSYVPGATLEVRDAETQAVIFSAAPEVWQDGRLDASSGDEGWWFDFSTVTEPGDYVIVDPSTQARSARL